MTVFFNNLKQIFSKPLNIILMIVLPVAFNLFFISVAPDAKYVIGVYDNDKTDFTKQMVENMDGGYKVVELKEEEDVKSAVLNSNVDCAIVFEKDFTKRIIKGEISKAQYYGLNDTNSTQPLKMYIQSCINAAVEIGKASAGNEQTFYKGLTAYYEGTYKINYQKLGFSQAESVGRAVSSLGYIAISMMFLTTFATILIIKDKMCGVYNRILVSPFKSSNYFLQHLLSYFIVSFIQVILLVDLMPNIANVNFGNNLEETLSLIIVCLCFSTVCISIGVTISRFANKTIVAGSLVSLLNIPMLMLGGCFWPREIMPDTLKTIGDYMPTTWFLKGTELVLYGNGLFSAFKYIVFMLIFSMVLMIIAFGAKTVKTRLSAMIRPRYS